MTLPTKLPRWDTTDAASTEPSSAYVEAGFSAGDRPPAEWYNWLQQHNADWLSALRTAAVLDIKVDTDADLGSVTATLFDGQLAQSDTAGCVYLATVDEISVIRHGHLTPSIERDTSVTVPFTATCATVSHLVGFTADAAQFEGAWPIDGDIALGTVTAVGLGAALTASGLTTVTVEAAIYSELLGGIIAGVHSANAGGTFSIWTGTVGGAWTNTYAETAVGGTAVRSTCAAVGTDSHIIARATSYYTADSAASSWAKSSSADATNATLGIAYRSEDDVFYAAKGDTTAELYAVSAVSATTADAQVDVLFVNAAAGGGAFAVAVAPDGGMLVVYQSYESADTWYQRGKIRARYWPPGRTPGATADDVSESTGIDVAWLYDTGTSTPTNSTDKYLCPRALTYDPAGGCFVGLLAYSDGSGDLTHRVYTTRPMGF